MEITCKPRHDRKKEKKRKTAVFKCENRKPNQNLAKSPKTTIPTPPSLRFTPVISIYKRNIPSVNLGTVFLGGMPLWLPWLDLAVDIY